MDTSTPQFPMEQETLIKLNKLENIFKKEI